jgi:hypothetical protein
MAVCPKCDGFYQPTPEEERLIASGQMEPLCMNCAVKNYREREKELPPSAPMPLRETVGKTDGTKLSRVERFDAKGLSVTFTALPLLPTKSTPRILRKKKKGEDTQHVMILSNDAGRTRATNEPRVVLHTNLSTYQESKSPLLWFSKIPSYWCPFTGVGRIEVPSEDVTDVRTDADGKVTELHLQDGGLLRLSYR